MQWFQDTFNSYFGSNITYVANAYSTERDRFVRFTWSTTRLEADKIEAALNPTDLKVSLETRWQRVSNAQLLRIPYGRYHKQERRETYAYMTLISDDEVLLTSNYEIGANKSYILTKEGQVVRQKYGSSNLFEDECGYDHTPQ